MIKIKKDIYPLIERIFDFALKGNGLLVYNLLREIERHLNIINNDKEDILKSLYNLKKEELEEIKKEIEKLLNEGKEGKK